MSLYFTRRAFPGLCGRSQKRSPSNNIKGQVPKKKPKSHPYFKPRETWTHTFVVLGSIKDEISPSKEELYNLQQAGLGKKKIVFPDKSADHTSFISVLSKEFPKIKDGGGVELLRAIGGGGGQRRLELLPLGNEGFSIPYLRDGVCIGTATIYVRPLQKDLDLSPVISDVSLDIRPTLVCLTCGKDVVYGDMKNHRESECGESKDEVQSISDSRGFDDYSDDCSQAEPNCRQPCIEIGERSKHGHIMVEYKHFKKSRYSCDLSVLVSNSREDCWLQEEREFQAKLDSEPSVCPDIYDPLNSIWVISKITKGEVVYLESSMNEYPAINIKINGVDPETESLIAYGPEEICGVAAGSLCMPTAKKNCVVLGCLPVKMQKSEDSCYLYTWYHNGSLFKEGKKCCLIYVFSPGSYKCKLTLGSRQEVSREVMVVHKLVDNISRADQYCNDSSLSKVISSSTCNDASTTPTETATAHLESYSKYVAILTSDDEDQAFIAAIEESTKDNNDNEALMDTIKDSTKEEENTSPPSQGHTEIIQKYVSENIQAWNNTTIVISRKSILQTTIRATNRKSFSFFNPLTVTFAGEEGVDEGGPKREFLRLLMLALAGSPVFQGSWLSHDLSLLNGKKYEELGKLTAWSVLQGGNGPRCLSEQGYKLMRGFKYNKTTAIEEVCPDLKPILKTIDAATSEEDFAKCKGKYSDTIAQYGYSRIYTSKMVDKEEIIDCLLRQYYVYGVQSEFLQLIEGMNSIGKFGDILMAHESVFNAVLGNKKEKLTASKFKCLYTVENAEKGSNTRSMEDSTMYCFELFLLDLEEGLADGVGLEDLLVFITGAESPPLLGFDCPITIQFYNSVGKEKRYPSSSTCSLTLYLPRGVEEPDDFKKLMRDSILESHGFGKG